MKKLLMTLAVAIAFGGMTTGCAAKKRVQRLEEELLRCKEMNRKLKQKAQTEPEEANPEEQETLAARDESSD